MCTDTLPEPLNRLEKEATIFRKLECGERLFTQNGTTGGLFYLISGTIELKRTTVAGHSVTIHRARGGDTFAEASLFTDKYHCTGTTATEVKLIECARQPILQLLRTDIDFAINMTSRFATQIQESRRQVELLSIRAADERVIAAIEDGLLTGDIVNFADIIGLAPETVYRSLAQLTQEGRIRKAARGQYQLKERAQ